MPDTPVERIGRYEVLTLLGQGAMGIVYKARDPQLDRIVAVKTLRRDLGLPPDQYDQLRTRFYQEAMAAGRLNHANIVAVHDVVEIGEIPYIVMEYLEGRTLADLIAAEGPLPPRRAVRVAAQVCDALAYAHAHGVVHRDIKPGNIVIAANDAAKVGDFGIARIAGSDVTQTGVLLGTPAYMSPEQLGGRVVDGRSDQFSLSVVLYESLTGVNPFRGEELATVLYRIAHVSPAPMRERNPAVPPGLEAATARGLAKDPAQRYPDARSFGEALTLALEKPAAPAAPPAPPRTAAPTPSRPKGRGPRRRARLIGAACLLLLAAGGWGLWGPSAVPVGGSIVVTTNPSVEVYVDGAFQGQTAENALVIPNVATGERVVTLRLGSRERDVRGTVLEGQAWSVTYHFPPDLGPPIKGALREAQEKFREVQDRVKDALDTPRAVLDRLRGALGNLGSPGRTKQP